MLGRSITSPKRAGFERRPPHKPNQRTACVLHGCVFGSGVWSYHMPRRSASSAQSKTIQPIGQSKIEGDFLRIAMGPGTLAEKAAMIGMHKNTFDKERKARADQIALQTRIELDESVHHAMRTLVDLLDCDDPNARYKAAKDILDRAGFKPTDKLEVTAEVKRTPKEIEAEIRQRMGDEIASRLLGVDLKPAAPVEDKPVVEAEDADWERVDG